MSSHRLILRAQLSVAILLVVGCGGAPPRAIGDPDPSVKIPGIKDAVADKDLSDADRLVKDLESDDPAVRFYAIEGLRRLTGETHGYSYYADEAARDVAVRKWKRWLQMRDAQPAGAGERTN
jgi:hypothetical protein